MTSPMEIDPASSGTSKKKQEEKLLRYKRSLGVDASHGHKFEWEITLLAYLRCEKLHREWIETGNSGIKSFFVANNVQNIGAFDDIVVRAEYVDGCETRTKLIFVQCKHVADSGKSETRFEKYMNDPSQIRKWFESFIKVHHFITKEDVPMELLDKVKNKRLKLELHKTQREQIRALKTIFDCYFSDCEFIFISNMDPELDQISQMFDCSASSNYRFDFSSKILKTTETEGYELRLKESALKRTDDRNYYKTDVDMFEKEFCNKFRAILNQKDGIEFFINKEIALYSQSIRNIDNIRSELITELQRHFNASEYCEPISEISKVIRNVLYFMELKFKATEIMDEINSPLSSCLFSNEALQELNTYLKPGEILTIRTKFSKLEKLKLIQIFMSLNEECLLLFLNNDEDYSSWTCARKTNSYKAFSKIIIFSESVFTLSVLFKNETFIEVVEEDVHNNYLDQLTEDAQNALLQSNVCFQGVAMKLSDICRNKWRKVLNETVILNILENKPIYIGEPLPTDNFYLPRKLQIETFTNEYFIVLKRFLMSFQGENKFIVITEGDGVIESFGDYLTARNFIQNFMLETDKTYHFCHLQNKELELLWSFGKPKKCTEFKVVNVEYLFNICHNIKILHDVVDNESSLLFLAHKYKEKYPTHLVSYIKIRKFLNALKTPELIIKAPTVENLARLLLSLKGVEFNFFKVSCMENWIIVLFFDGIDEISEADCELFSSCLLTLRETASAHIFVSSTPKRVHVFEKAFLTKSITYKDITTNDIARFLYKNDLITKAGECETILHSASKIGNTTIIKTLLKCDISLLNKKNARGHTPLHLACLENNLEVVKLLLTNSECCARTLDNHSNTALHLASRHGNTEIIMLLLVRDHDQINMRNIKGQTPLCLACNENNCEAIMIFLIHQNCDVGIFTNNGDSILHACMKNVNNEVLKQILKRDHTLLNKQNKEGESPLHLAVSVHNDDAVMYLISNSDCSVNLMDKYDNTVLHYACKINNIAITKILLERDPTLLNTQNCEGESPLHLAISAKSVDVLKYILIFPECSVDLMDKNGNTPLHYACKMGDNEIICILLQRDPNLLNRQNINGSSPLHLAIMANNMNAVKYLLSVTDCHIALNDCTGNTVLHHASQVGNIEMIKLLLEKDHTLCNMRNENDQTPLQLAEKENNIHVVNSILKYSHQSISSVDEVDNTVQHDSQIVIETRTEILGCSHTDTLNSMSGKASVLRRMENFEEAPCIYNHVIEKKTEILDANDASILTVMHNKASILNDIGNYEEALNIYDKVIKILSEKVGENYPDTLISMKNKASVLNNLRKYEESINIYNHVIEMMTKILGEKHSDTVKSMKNKASVLKNMGKYENSLNICNHVIKIETGILGENHPSVLKSMENKASVLNGIGKYEEALCMYNHVFEKMAEILGKHHPNTLDIMYNKVSVLENLGKYKEALSICKQVIEIKTEKMGVDHPHSLSRLLLKADILENITKIEGSLSISN